MGRPANLNIQTPGSTGAPAAAAAQANTEPDEQFSGEGEAGASEQSDKDAEIAALKAQLAALSSKPNLPQVVTEPVTPHGAIALAQSQFSHMTVAQLMAGIDTGQYREPTSNSVLCSDGWYCRRGMSS
jgi:hypothetical protein